MLIPIFTYCSIVTSLYTETTKKISSFEKRACYIIFDKKNQNSPKVSYLHASNVCNFEGYFDVLKNYTRNGNKLLRFPRVKLERNKEKF